jgi:hypothetical protein
MQKVGLGLGLGKRIWQKKIWLQIPPTIFISSLKKNPAENYMASDPANFCHQLPQKESGRKLYGSRSHQLSSSAPSKRIRRKIIWLQIPPTFCIISLKKNPAENHMAPDPANNLLISSGLMKSQLKTPKEV